MVLIEGEYTPDETIRVLAMGHPPSERRDVARAIHGHVDFMGIGAFSLKDDAKYRPVLEAHEDVGFVVMSDLWLDHPKTLPALRRVFEGYSAAEFRPYAFVFCGNFSVRGWEGASSIASYTGEFRTACAAERWLMAWFLQPASRSSRTSSHLSRHSHPIASFCSFRVPQIRGHRQFCRDQLFRRPSQKRFEIACQRHASRATLLAFATLAKKLSSFAKT